MSGALQAVSALTVSSEPSLLALPSSSTVGTIRVYDTLVDAGTVLCEIQAHKTAVVSALVSTRCAYKITGGLCDHRVADHEQENFPELSKLLRHSLKDLLCCACRPC